MAKANIISGELKISVEGTSEEIKEILEGVGRIENRKNERMERMERMERWREYKNKRDHKKNNIIHRELNLTNILMKIAESDYFSEPKTAREVLFRLEHDGNHIPSTTLHPILARLVMKGILKREHNDSGIWAYKRVLK